MVIIGMDPHKASNTIAVLDSTENLLTRRRFENSDDGFVEMLAAVGEYPESGVGRRGRERDGTQHRATSRRLRRTRL